MGLSGGTWRLGVVGGGVGQAAGAHCMQLGGTLRGPSRQSLRTVTLIQRKLPTGCLYFCVLNPRGATRMRRACCPSQPWRPTEGEAQTKRAAGQPTRPAQ